MDADCCARRTPAAATRHNAAGNAASRVGNADAASGSYEPASLARAAATLDYPKPLRIRPQGSRRKTNAKPSLGKRCLVLL